MLTQHIALVSDTDAVSLAELARVSAALQRQVTDDLGPVWGVSATVDPFASLEEVPIGYWPLVVSREALGTPAGVHLDRDGQPYARVEAALVWSLDASRAALEMLVDPFGSRTALGVSPRGDRAAAEVLVEVCAPCAGTGSAYVINDVIVSDFCTPAFFAVTPEARGGRYSWSGTLQAPLSVLPGGHLSWHEAEDDAWWVRSHYGDNPVDTRLGSLLPGNPARALVSARAPQRPVRRKVPLALAAQLRMNREHAAYVGTVRAERLRGHMLEGQVSAAELAAGVVVEVVAELRKRPPVAEPIMEVVAAEVDEAVLIEPEPIERGPIEREPIEPPVVEPTAFEPTAVEAAALEPASPASVRAPRKSSIPPSLPPSLAPPVSLAPRERLSALGSRDEESRRMHSRLWLYAGGALAFGGALALWLDGRSTSHTTARPRAVASAPAAVEPLRVTPPAPTLPPRTASEVASLPASALPPAVHATQARHDQLSPAAGSAPSSVPAPVVSAARAPRLRAAPSARVAKRVSAPAPVPPAPSLRPPTPAAVQSSAPVLADLLDTRK